MTASTPLSLCRDLQPLLRARHWRLPVLIEGAAEPVLARCHALLEGLPFAAVLWVSGRAPAGAWTLPRGKPNHALGQEADAVVVDLFDGLSVDALAAVAGLVRAGGALILLAPPLAQWPVFDDPEYARLTVEPFGPAGTRRHFLTRLARVLARSPLLCRWMPEGEVRWPAAWPQWLDGPAQSPPQVDDWGCLNPSQRALVEAVLHLASGHRQRPLVVLADRGRGKSAALGLAAGRLLQQGKSILVTAPRPENAACLQRFAAVSAGNGGQGRLAFVAPDRLSQTLPPADLLLVDEAAAIAPALLRDWLQRYPRILFASTVQGYEGTGRGFAIRFFHTLDRLAPDWKKLTLTEPVRWAAGDPLESLLNELLLLDACDEACVPAPAGLPFTPLQELTPHLADLPEPDLRALFGLLASAHYRTRPSDLRTLLDGPNVRVFAQRSNGTLLAVVMVAEEGRLPPALADAILEGRRRPHGHVLPQSLAVHLNVQAALTQRMWRVVRIAVHSQWRRQGLGQHCLRQLRARAEQENVALLGSLFAASDDVLAFWHAGGFQSLRVGLTPEATSGAWPVLVARAVQPAGDSLLHQARQRFEQTFLHSLPDRPHPLPANLVLAAWDQARSVPPSPPGADDRLDLNHFLAGHKTYENAAPALWRHLLYWLARPDWHPDLTAGEQTLLVGKILQKQPWETLIAATGCVGQRDARERLRQLVQRLHQRVHPPENPDFPLPS